MQYITTQHAPEALGPYSQAIRAGNLLFCSGQVAIHPETGKLEGADGDVGRQTERVLRNVQAVLRAGGAELSDVVKTTVYMTKMADFPALNAVYEEYFGSHKPARACVEVSQLPKGAVIEIDAIAVVGVTAE
jgi:2-iminobutanoate/2-iminopropanoate deaminase